MLPMVLTPNQQQLIIDAISSRLETRDLVCPISGDSQWTVQDRVALAPLIDLPELNLRKSHRALPLAVLTCETCGYTTFVNLLQLGLGDALNLGEVKDG